MKKTYFWAIMWVLTLTFTAICLTQCKAESRHTTVCMNERDSMIMCVDEFDKVFSLDDTILEEPEGEESFNAWESYIQQDTIDIETARELFIPMAANMLFVLKCQEDYYCRDAEIFSGRWTAFLRKYSK